MRLNAKQLRDLEEQKVIGPIHEVKRQPIYFILENIYDTYNIGGLFRLADALAIEKMYLCGDTEIPPNSRIKKASVGTYKVVPWEYKQNANEAIEELRKKYSGNGYETRIGARLRTSSPLNDTGFVTATPKRSTISIIAIEQHSTAIPYTKAEYTLPLALVFGNESYGILPETLKLVDQIVEIPMWGINKSLNVIVSAAIVSYYAINNVMVE